jgi:hypothetical protein
MGFRSCPFCVIRRARLTSVLGPLTISSPVLGDQQVKVIRPP